jgi:V/A-type H+-transporting ATPase subunit I
MSKIELAGPKGLLEDVISLMQEAGTLQVDTDEFRCIEVPDEHAIQSMIPDEKTISERFFLEELRKQIEELFTYFPVLPLRVSYLEPGAIIDTVAEMLKKQVRYCRDLHQKKEALYEELVLLGRYGPFFETIAVMVRDNMEVHDLDFIGVTIKEPEAIENIRGLLSRLTDGKFELLTAVASDNSLVGIIALKKEESERVRNAIGEEYIPELTFPPHLGRLSLPEQLAYLKEKTVELSSEADAINSELQQFALRWGPIYGKVREWIYERLSVLKASTATFETQMCFFIRGWMPSREVNLLRDQVNKQFSGKVILDEKEIREEDLDRIPVILKNPSYFRPFEIFTNLLPLPRYTSYDPTTFIGIFFPIIFGMILGDAGYGLLLIVVSLFLIKKLTRKIVRDAGRIMFISSLYTVIFGFLYGEFFGDIGHMLFGMKPICIERRTAVIPMLYFSITAGLAHIMLGLVLGAIAAVRRKTKKEALYKLINIFMILCILALVASFFGLFPELFRKPVIIAIFILTPLLLFTGGLLAPLELLKSIGSIISYARIMAIGLTSVLLAFVANRIAGMTGDIVTGVVAAGLIHLLNIVLGIFSPTIHSLRLHYVEFFGKFIEHGGRKFEPLQKAR